MSELTDALRNGQQCDEDGVICIVSRQACHEAAARIEALEAQMKALTQVIQPKMAAELLKTGAHKCVLSSDEHLPGWVSGLFIDRSGEVECVAHLDHEDSQYGPRLWDYALSVLKAYATVAQIKGGA